MPTEDGHSNRWSYKLLKQKHSWHFLKLTYFVFTIRWLSSLRWRQASSPFSFDSCVPAKFLIGSWHFFIRGGAKFAMHQKIQSSFINHIYLVSIELTKILRPYNLGMPICAIGSHFVLSAREFPLDLLFQPSVEDKGWVFSSVTTSCWNQDTVIRTQEGRDVGKRPEGIQAMGHSSEASIWFADPAEETGSSHIKGTGLHQFSVCTAVCSPQLISEWCLLAEWDSAKISVDQGQKLKNLRKHRLLIDRTTYLESDLWEVDLSLTTFSIPRNFHYHCL